MVHVFMSATVRSKEELKNQMEDSYPEALPAGQLSRLYNRWKRLCAQPICYPTLPEEVYCLLDAIKWGNLPWGGRLTLLDPCAGTASITQTLHQELGTRRLRYLTNDIHPAYQTDYHLDATLPSSWEHLPAAEIVCCSPPYELLDILMPEFIKRTKIVAMLHVPGDYISNGPQYRRQLWQRLERQGRTATIEGLPRVAGRPMRRCAWILLFRSAMWKRLLWKPVGNRLVMAQYE
jgi:hypothetical protein